MTWDELTDRCQLYCDAPRNLLKKLLQEAEEELTRNCDIYEVVKAFDTKVEYDNRHLPYNTDSQGIKYDTNEVFLYDKNHQYKKMIVATWKGRKLKPVDELESHYDSDNKVYTGEPTGYWIHNDSVVLNKDPGATTSKLLIKYYAMIKNNNYTDELPLINPMYHKDLCDYAISVATAKENPQLSVGHFNLWMSRIELIKTQEGDRELNPTIREEI